ncbi:hypothetical protein NB037_12710 [Rathayibacter sp. ZW T2_19]|uniref:Uncharacterized protein n=1 Tax=Rathayibacter rubneri TaxID=2950106 RepID=A0A9X2DY88_9MICO|nr:hypothetical protein [Rathayibacter rubneri]MCM6763280.1 hypothetical protein [Rathayibacter rubneri]
MKNSRVVFYLIGGVLILGSGISSAMQGDVSVPDIITIVCGLAILALAAWEYFRTQKRESGSDDPKAGPPR